MYLTSMDVVVYCDISSIVFCGSGPQSSIFLHTAGFSASVNHICENEPETA